MYWPDEIRAPEFDVLAKPVELRTQEMALAGNLTELLSAPFDPTQFVDGHRQRLEELAQAKVEGEEVVIAPAAAGAQVGDLLEALRASVEAEKEKEKTRKEPKPSRRRRSGAGGGGAAGAGGGPGGG
jgi:DNA end-binding protein Ku